MKTWASVHLKVNPGLVHLEESESKQTKGRKWIKPDEGLMESALSEVCVCVRLTATDTPRLQTGYTDPVFTVCPEVNFLWLQTSLAPPRGTVVP